MPELKNDSQAQNLCSPLSSGLNKKIIMHGTYTIHDYQSIAEIKMHTMPFINKVINDGHAADMILVTEAIQEKTLVQIAESIAGNDAKKVVLLAGPSSSGKTSTSKRLCIQLMACRKHPVALSMDNWYVNRVDTPLDENGKPDFESIYSIDLQQFHDDIAKLMAGEEIMLPTYNFVTGKREYRGERLRLKKNMILVIEGIHALNPMVSEQIDHASIFRIYAAPMSPISLDGEHWVPTTVNRLLRRISRDVQTRGRSPQETIAEWESVRAGEKKWIEPFKDNADALFDTSMLYELAALRRKAEPVLQSVPKDIPEYIVVKHLLEFLQCFQPIELEQIPHTSLLREFVGGSIFEVG